MPLFDMNYITQTLINNVKNDDNQFLQVPLATSHRQFDGNSSNHNSKTLAPVTVDQELEMALEFEKLIFMQAKFQDRQMSTQRAESEQKEEEKDNKATTVFCTDNSFYDTVKNLKAKYINTMESNNQFNLLVSSSGADQNDIVVHYQAS